MKYWWRRWCKIPSYCEWVSQSEGEKKSRSQTGNKDNFSLNKHVYWLPSTINKEQKDKKKMPKPYQILHNAIIVMRKTNLKTFHLHFKSKDKFENFPLHFKLKKKEKDSRLRVPTVILPGILVIVRFWPHAHEFRNEHEILQVRLCTVKSALYHSFMLPFAWIKN